MIVRQLQLENGGGVPKIIDSLHVAPTPLQSMPVHVAVITGQFVTMTGPVIVMGLVQQVLVQPSGPKKVKLVVLHGTI